MIEKSYPGLIGSELAKKIDAKLQEIEDNPMTPLIREHRKHLAKQGKEHELIVYEASAARIFIYCGEFVAECPQRGCSNVEYMTDKRVTDRGDALVWGERRTMFHCTYCKLVTDIIRWPEEGDEFMKVLNRRPFPHNRNWFPEGHIIAVRSGTPHGQSLQDLIDENHEHGVY